MHIDEPDLDDFDSLAGPDAATSPVEFDDGLLERLGDMNDYVSAAPAAVSKAAFAEQWSSSRGSLSDRLADAQRERGGSDPLD